MTFGGEHLEDSSLVLAVGAVETRKACTSTILVITDTSTRAVTPSLVTVSIKGIRAGRTLLQLAGRATVASVTETTNMLHCIPRGIVCANGLASKVLLGPASSTVVTVIRTSRTLASDTVVAREALARPRLAVTCTLVGALYPRMEVVRVNNISNPCEIARASAKTAVRTGPLWLAVEACETLAVAILLACSVVGTVVLTQTTIAMAALVPCDLTPSLDRIGGGSGRGIRRRHRSQAVTGSVGSRWRIRFISIMRSTSRGFGYSYRAIVVGGTQGANTIQAVGTCGALCSSSSTWESDEGTVGR